MIFAGDVVHGCLLRRPALCCLHLLTVCQIESVHKVVAASDELIQRFPIWALQQIRHIPDARVRLPDLVQLSLNRFLHRPLFGLLCLSAPGLLFLLHSLHGRILFDQLVQGFLGQLSALQFLLQFRLVLLLPPRPELVHVRDRFLGEGIDQAGLLKEGCLLLCPFLFPLLSCLAECFVYGCLHFGLAASGGVGSPFRFTLHGVRFRRRLSVCVALRVSSCALLPVPGVHGALAGADRRRRVVRRRACAAVRVAVCDSSRCVPSVALAARVDILACASRVRGGGVLIVSACGVSALRAQTECLIQFRFRDLHLLLLSGCFRCPPA